MWAEHVAHDCISGAPLLKCSYLPYHQCRCMHELSIKEVNYQHTMDFHNLLLLQCIHNTCMQHASMHWLYMPVFTILLYGSKIMALLYIVDVFLQTCISKKCCETNYVMTYDMLCSIASSFKICWFKILMKNNCFPVLDITPAPHWTVAQEALHN